MLFLVTGELQGLFSWSSKVPSCSKSQWLSGMCPLKEPACAGLLLMSIMWDVEE